MKMNRNVLTCIILMISISTFACSNTVTSPSDTTTLATFSSIQSTVLNANCAISGCHNGIERPSLVAGSAYNNIVNVKSTQNTDYIKPGNPNNSYLYLKLTGVNIFGNRMPRGLPALSQTTLDSIKVWIERGALNN